ncbi:unnamed protein product [Closterium sp. Yama58-4]|nr:unnamed protein product [Closterium sp. Yama58-4]
MCRISLALLAPSSSSTVLCQPSSSRETPETDKSFFETDDASSSTTERRQDAEGTSPLIQATPKVKRFKISPPRVCPNAPTKPKPDLRRKMSPQAAKRLFRSLKFEDVEVNHSPSP